MSLAATDKESYSSRIVRGLVTRELWGSADTIAPLAGPITQFIYCGLRIVALGCESHVDVVHAKVGEDAQPPDAL